MSDTCPICNNPLESGISVCPACGYKLPGSTQEFKPIQSRLIGIGEPNQDKIQGELRIVRGPQTGLDITIKQGSLTIGRDPQCDIFLNDMTVSRHHALLEASDNGCIISDTNSYNGVWVNDTMIEKCLLKSGDMIQIGAFCIVYREHL